MSSLFLSPHPLPIPAIALLKDQEPGAFIIRDSHSFRGAYGLAMKVSSPPPTIMQQNKKGSTLTSSRVQDQVVCPASSEPEVLKDPVTSRGAGPCRVRLFRQTSPGPGGGWGQSTRKQNCRDSVVVFA